jgi:hypothetical protein
MRRLNALVDLSRCRVPAVCQQCLADSDPLGCDTPTARFELGKQPIEL